jgi:hypothetical protein
LQLCANDTVEELLEGVALSMEPERTQSSQDLEPQQSTAPLAEDLHGEISMEEPCMEAVGQLMGLLGNVVR